MADKKNVLFIASSLGRGGMERAALRTADSISAEYIPHFLTLSDREIEYPCPYERLKSPNLFVDENDSRYKIVRFIKFLKNCYRYWSSFRQWKRDNKIKYTFSFSFMPNCFNAITKAGDKQIFSIRNYSDTWVRGLQRLKFRFIYRRADTVTCVSDEIRDTMPKVLGLQKEKFVTLNNPYDTEHISAEAAEICDYVKKAPTLVAFGRLHKQKGFDLLLRAFKRILDVRKDVQLMFVGGGDELKYLEELSKELGVSENVSFLGVQANPFKYVAKGDILVMSSLYEGFPNAMVEAMICGLPIVSVDCRSGPREILDPGRSEFVKGIVKAQYGILTPELSRSMDADELDKRLAYLSDAVLILLENEDLRLEYAKLAKERAEDFSMDIFRKRLYEIMESL